MRKYAFALAAPLTSVLLSVPAYASELAGDGEQQGAGRLDAQLVPIKRAIGDLSDVMGQVFAVMVSNPLFVVLLAAGLFALGVRIFRRIKGVAK